VTPKCATGNTHHIPLIPAHPKPTQASVTADRMEDGSPHSDTSEEADKEGEDGKHLIRQDAPGIPSCQDVALNISQYRCIF